jgi:hypothetical protein
VHAALQHLLEALWLVQPVADAQCLAVLRLGRQRQLHHCFWSWLVRLQSVIEGYNKQGCKSKGYMHT